MGRTEKEKRIAAVRECLRKSKADAKESTGQAKKIE